MDIPMIIIEAVLMGVFATYLMDVLAGILAKRNIMFGFVTHEEVGGVQAPLILLEE